MPSVQLNLDVYAALRHGYAETGYVPSFSAVCQMLPEHYFGGARGPRRETRADVRAVLARLVERGILTEEGKHSGRHHLTDRGFIWIKKRVEDYEHSTNASVT